MVRSRMLLMAALLFGLSAPFVTGQDAGRKAKDSATKVRGQLPQNYGKLGLSEEQKQKIYRIQNDSREKIDELEQRIKDLKEKERKDVEGVLTAEQKARLRDILTGKAPAK